MATITLGHAIIDVDQDMGDEDIAVLVAAFAQLKQAYGSMPDESLAQAVFFNVFPGIDADAIVAATVMQLGSHS